MAESRAGTAPPHSRFCGGQASHWCRLDDARLDEGATFSRGSQEEGGVSLTELGKGLHNGRGEGESIEDAQAETGLGRPEPSTQEIDLAFQNAFLYAIYSAKKTGSAPHYGLKLPIQPAYLISNMIQPYLPIYHDSQAQYYNIKKTSWKNVKKFIKHLDKEQIVKSKDRNGNETIIFD